MDYLKVKEVDLQTEILLKNIAKDYRLFIVTMDKICFLS
jgi:hypothetical protein